MATNVSHRIPTAQAHASADLTGSDIIYLTGTETLQEFRRYVREIRARKQAERDADRRARGDTTGVRDTVKVLP